jgi:hypothetical protein
MAATKFEFPYDGVSVDRGYTTCKTVLVSLTPNAGYAHNPLEGGFGFQHKTFRFVFC